MLNTLRSYIINFLLCYIDESGSREIYSILSIRISVLEYSTVRGCVLLSIERLRYQTQLLTKRQRPLFLQSVSFYRLTKGGSL